MSKIKYAEEMKFETIKYIQNIYKQNIVVLNRRKLDCLDAA